MISYTKILTIQRIIVIVCGVYIIIVDCTVCSALRKLNEKKQVFNMYKTQKQKEEKVTVSCTSAVNDTGKFTYGMRC